jgi:hypothetical protein
VLKVRRSKQNEKSGHGHGKKNYEAPGAEGSISSVITIHINKKLLT